MITSWVAIVIALASLGVSVYVSRRAKLSSSVAILVSLYSEISAAWAKLIPAVGPQAEIEIGELMNRLEIASAILNENSIAGVSASLLRVYLREQLDLIDKNVLPGNPLISSAMKRLVNPFTAFEQLRTFCARESVSYAWLQAATAEHAIA